MVTRVRRCLPLGFIACLATAANVIQADNRSLQLQVATETVELGKALELKLIGDDLEALESFEPTSLLRDFAIADRSYKQDGQQQVLSLRLYARRTGSLRIPPLAVGKLTTRARDIQVTQARHPVTGDPMSVRFILSDAEPWTRQTLTLVAVVENTDRYLLSSWETPQLPGWDTQRLTAQNRQAAEQMAYYRHRLGWALKPFKPGETVLDFPPLVYSKNGVPTHRFHPPRTVLKVQPLPPYVPGNVPVGTLALEQMSTPAYVSSNRLQTITLKIKGRNLLGNALPPITNQLRDTAAVAFYPTQVQHRRQITAGAIASEAVYEIPFRRKQTGLPQALPLTLHYFDPASGKLHKEQFNLVIPAGVHPALQFTVITALVAIALWVGLRLGQRLMAILRRLDLYRRARRQLINARDAADIHVALQTSAAAECWNRNITVQTWFKYWENRYTGSIGSEELCQNLQAALYGPTARQSVVSAASQQLLHALYTAHPLLRLLPG